MIVNVPSTLPRLQKLAQLDMTGNMLVSMAVLPPLVELTGTYTPGADEWDTRTDPVTKKKYFVHHESHRVVRLKPPVLQQADKKLANAKKDVEPDEYPVKFGTEEYNRLRRIYARRGVNEWSIDWDETECAMVHENALTGQVTTSLPKDIDTFGRLKMLEELKLDRQRLRELPESFSKLVCLRKLTAKQNYIRALPEGIGGMRKLQVLNLTDNALSDLPESLGKLTSLSYLSLQSNLFEKLPSFVGHMKSVVQLMLGHNSLTTLPYEIGFADSLVELQVFNNPLDPVWYESITDLEKLKWHCRQKYWTLKNGPVPVVEYHAVSICDEVLEPEPAYKQRIAAALDKASKTGVLELQLQGVHEIPGAVLKRDKKRSGDTWSHPKLETVHTLKLNENAFPEPPLFTKSLAKMRVLWLKNCSVPALNEDIEHLQGLVELNLEANRIYSLPRTFTRLRRLERLNLAKNRLTYLPDDIGKMIDLKEVDLAMNRLERLPDSIVELRNVVDLSVAMNSIYTLPKLTSMAKLKRLNLDANDLNVLPPDLGELPLVTLRASHNRLEYLDEDTFGPVTCDTLEYLGIAANNLLELPSCLPRCERLVTLQVEYNPLRSPPPALVSQGMEVLRKYCDLRDSRMENFKQLLSDYNYEFDPGHLAPEAFNVLTGKTGFLSEEDLERFDRAVDAYLNGPYYTNTATDTEIVERLDALKHEREHVFYCLVLQELIATCDREIKGNGKFRRYGPGVLMDETRPWGRKGEHVGVYAIALDALVRDSPVSQFCSEARPAMYEVVKQNLPPSTFDYSLEVLKDAIQNYEGPYGNIAQLDKVQYARCECVDERGRCKGHRQCVLPSVVLVKTIYTASEAQRRVVEDDMIRNAWAKVWEDIDSQLDTRLGKIMQQQELCRRQANQGKLIRALKTTLQEKTRAVKHSLEYLEAAKNRKMSFEDGGAYAFHRFDSIDEAIKLVKESEKTVDARRADYKDCEKQLATAKSFTNIKKKMQLQKIALDLKQKYCALEYERILDENRRKAFENGWRRPWDGPEGVTFNDWTHANGLALTAGRAGPTVPRWVTKLAPKPRNDDELDDEAKFSYNWAGTDTMNLFANDRYISFEEEYINTIMNRLQGVGLAQDAKVARNLDTGAAT